jgi:hypothetical protein
MSLAAIAIVLLAAEGGAPPYPPSEVITGFTIDWTTHRRLAPGSDNWPMTWAADGTQFTSWGDGGGFGGTNSRGRVSNGFAVVEGGPAAYRCRNVAGGFDAPHPAPFSGKCYGLIAVDGTLYAWRTGEGSGATAYELQELWASDDGAVSWRATDVRFTQASFPAPDDHGFFAPAFLQCGQDAAAGPDNYVYAYAPDIQTAEWAVHRPGKLTLLRAPRDSMEDPKAYAYFAGLDNGAPLWTADVSERRPVFEDAAHGVMRTSAAYQPELGRYLLLVEHSERASGNLGLYEGPAPWGPWRTVRFERGWGRGHIETTAFYWNFAPAWWGDDGREFTLVFTGTDANDSWNTVRGQLETARP